jgi:hypothetical protein
LPSATNEKNARSHFKVKANAFGLSCSFSPTLTPHTHQNVYGTLTKIIVNHFKPSITGYKTFAHLITTHVNPTKSCSIFILGHVELVADPDSAILGGMEGCKPLTCTQRSGHDADSHHEPPH